MLLYILIGAVGFLAGWLVSRNNNSIFEPIAEKIDAKFDELKAKLEALEDKVDGKK